MYLREYVLRRAEVEGRVRCKLRLMIVGRRSVGWGEGHRVEFSGVINQGHLNMQTSDGGGMFVESID